MGHKIYGRSMNRRLKLIDLFLSGSYNLVLWDDNSTVLWQDNSLVLWGNEVWILLQGVWNDNGVWVDTSLWID